MQRGQGPGGPESVSKPPTPAVAPQRRHAAFCGHRFSLAPHSVSVADYAAAAVRVDYDGPQFRGNKLAKEILLVTTKQK